MAGLSVEQVRLCCAAVYGVSFFVPGAIGADRFESICVSQVRLPRDLRGDGGIKWL